MSDPLFRDDDGSADPSAAAALSAYAAGTGSEHDALTALAATRLLVPVVAVLADEPGAGDSEAGSPRGGEKNSEMAMPKLIGRDGRAAIPAFTSLEALARWQPSARPVPAAAADVWHAAAGESCAVIVDVAGPVPLAVEGARLDALARGAAAPLPHEDPDVRDTVAALLAQAAATAGGASGGPARFALRPGADDGDLVIDLVPPAALDRAGAQAFAADVGSSVMRHLGGRLRRGIAIAIAPGPAPSP